MNIQVLPNMHVYMFMLQTPVVFIYWLVVLAVLYLDSFEVLLVAEVSLHLDVNCNAWQHSTFHRKKLLHLMQY